MNALQQTASVYQNLDGRRIKEQQAKEEERWSEKSTLLFTFPSLAVMALSKVISNSAPSPKLHRGPLWKASDHAFHKKEVDHERLNAEIKDEVRERVGQEERDKKEVTAVRPNPIWEKPTDPWSCCPPADERLLRWALYWVHLLLFSGMKMPLSKVCLQSQTACTLEKSRPRKSAPLKKEMLDKEEVGFRESGREGQIAAFWRGI